MIKVLFFTTNLLCGGAEAVLTNLVNRMDKSQFDITLQTMFDVGVYQKQLDKNVRYIGGFPRYFRGNTIVYQMLPPWLLYRLYVREDYDVVVSFLEGPSARVISGKKKGQKAISWIHTKFDNEETASVGFRSIQKAQKAYSKFNRIISVSKESRRAFENWFPQKNPVDVIYNVIEKEQIRQLAQEPVLDVIFREDEVNIICVGKVCMGKGVDRLAFVLKELRKQAVPAHIYLIGTGEATPEIEKDLEMCKLKDYWTMTGYRKNPYKYVKNADLYVCASRREGFSTAVSEALVLGIPIVSTNVSGTEELLGVNQEYGIVTENDENALLSGILKLLNTPGLMEHYRQQATVRGEKFDAQKAVLAVEKLLREVAGKECTPKLHERKDEVT